MTWLIYAAACYPAIAIIVAAALCRAIHLGKVHESGE